MSEASFLEILAVDDEPFVLDLIVTALEEGGCSVIPAHSAIEALDILAARATSLGGLVTDVNLGTPQMSSGGAGVPHPQIRRPTDPPIHHRLADRVRAHILLCMLAYYVEWHMREAWRELMFADEDQDARRTADPVAPAVRSDAARHKAAHRRLADGSPVHSFQTLLAELAAITRNTCRAPRAPDAATFQVTTIPTPHQQRALDLIETIAP